MFAQIITSKIKNPTTYHPQGKDMQNTLLCIICQPIVCFLCSAQWTAK